MRGSGAVAILRIRGVDTPGASGGVPLATYTGVSAYGYIMTPIRERASTPADLGRRLAHLRAQRGLTQSEVAEELGISRRYVCEMEAGKPSLYSTRLFRLLELLNAELVVEGEGVA